MMLLAWILLAGCVLGVEMVGLERFGASKSSSCAFNLLVGLVVVISVVESVSLLADLRLDWLNGVRL